jgi:hypothetical protein
MSDIDHFDNIDSDFSADDTPFDTKNNHNRMQSLMSGEEELEEFNQQDDVSQEPLEDDRDFSRKNNMRGATDDVESDVEGEEE